MTIEKELQNYGKAIVKNFLRKYYNEYKNKSLDIDDLIQEAHIVIWGILKDERFKDKPHKELKKIISQAVGWRLKMLRRDSLNRPAVPISQLFDFNEDEVEPISEIIQSGSETKSQISFDELKFLCDTRECKIISDYYHKSKTLNEIGQDLKLTPQGVRFILKKALKRIRKYYFKTS